MTYLFLLQTFTCNSRVLWDFRMSLSDHHNEQQQQQQQQKTHLDSTLATLQSDAWLRVEE